MGPYRTPARGAVNDRRSDPPQRSGHSQLNLCNSIIRFLTSSDLQATAARSCGNPHAILPTSFVPKVQLTCVAKLRVTRVHRGTLGISDFVRHTSIFLACSNLVHQNEFVVFTTHLSSGTQSSHVWSPTLLAGLKYNNIYGSMPICNDPEPLGTRRELGATQLGKHVILYDIYH